MFKKMFPAMCVTMIAVIIGIAAAAQADTFTVISPEPNKTYYAGNTITIGWTQQGNTVKTVNVWLYGDMFMQIKTSPTAEGGYHFDWTIPDTFPEGNYRVRIYPGGTSDLIQGGFFSIKKKLQPSFQGTPLQCKINITSPVAGQTCYVNETCMVIWDRSNLKPYGSVDARLVQFDAQHPSGLEGYKFVLMNNNDYAWVIPADVGPLDATYQIKIQTDDNKCVGKSGIFNIKKRLQMPDRTKGKKLQERIAQ